MGYGEPKTFEKVTTVCAQCGRPTNHDVLHSHDSSQWGGYDDEIGVFESHQVVRCRGCDLVAFRHTSLCTEDLHGGSDEEETLAATTVRTYPRHLDGRSVVPLPLTAPWELRAIYKETVEALAGDQPVLAGIGLRLLVELVCKHHKAKGRRLVDKINDLATTGKATAASVAYLHGTRLVGNKAAHEAHAAKPEVLAAVLDIVEHMLRDAFLLPIVSKHLPTP